MFTNLLIHLGDLALKRWISMLIPRGIGSRLIGQVLNPLLNLLNLYRFAEDIRILRAVARPKLIHFLLQTLELPLQTGICSPTSRIQIDNWEDRLQSGLQCCSLLFSTTRGILFLAQRQLG